MISVDEALARVLDLVAPLGSECVDLRAAAGRVLAGPVTALRDQPPFASSAMDGYAVADPAASPGQSYRIAGESAAGHAFAGQLSGDAAVRIFTGAPVPPGAVQVLLQEDVVRRGDTITVVDHVGAKDNIRPAALDFAAGDQFAPERRLTAADIALIAAMGHGRLPVRRRPEIALIATGDELVMPGEIPGPDQITASNHLGLAAMIERAGGIARLLPIARDTEASLSTALDAARGSDLIVTIGGASVGDHDLVSRHSGLDRAFYKVAMRPGKPLMAGRLDGTPMIGLPGNPVSAMVCGVIFILPGLRRMSGLAPAPAPRVNARLGGPLPSNGPREHYMRAWRDGDAVHVFDEQDSSRLGILARADALVIRPPGDPARREGEAVTCVALD